MNLKKHLVLVLASLTFMASTSALAYIVPGDRDRGPVQPRPLPPQRGSDGYTRPGQTEQRQIFLNRRFVNEAISLRPMMGLDSRYDNYVVESVMVDVRSSSVGSSVDLIINGAIQQQVRSPIGRLFLTPQSYTLLGRDMNSLRLGFRNMVDVQAVYVNLRDDRGYSREIAVPLYVSRRMIGNDRLDLGFYFDMNRYRGYRIQAVEIQAHAIYNTALVDLMINGYRQGQTVQLSPYSQVHVIYPTNAIIGQGAESLILSTRGDLDLREVVLKLVPR